MARMSCIRVLMVFETGEYFNALSIVGSLPQAAGEADMASI